jgi:hypothetical protein
VRTRRVFLIESLDAAGTGLGDARAHLEALECAGHPGRAVAVERRVDREPRDPDAAVSRGRVAVIHERAQLLAALGSAHADFVVVASAATGGGAVAGWLPAGLPARWWPTGLAAPEDDSTVTGRVAGAGLAPLGGGDAGPFAGLEWSVVDGPRAARSRLALWDGDYVLVPSAFAGRAGEEALRAFAAVAGDWDSIDLVVLAHPQDDFAALARELGVGTRVHFAGPSPREAEYAWAGAASALMLATEGAISGGLVLRALASGCPVLPLGDDVPGLALRDWLERSGLIATRAAGVPGGAGLELARILDRDRPVEQTIERGRALAAIQRVDRLAPRLAAALATDLEDRSQAA